MPIAHDLGISPIAELGSHRNGFLDLRIINRAAGQSRASDDESKD
jgi:hypothetical protein